MALPKDKAWFPAKSYGYGWGFPSRKEGWMAMIGYFIALFGTTLLAGYPIIWLFIYSIAITVAFLSLCFWKGEAAGWRWGDDNPPAAVQKEPNQPVQRNAGSRPPSGDSPASETRSESAPRG